VLTLLPAFFLSCMRLGERTIVADEVFIDDSLFLMWSE
jgi:hypothetical protein